MKNHDSFCRIQDGPAARHGRNSPLAQPEQTIKQRASVRVLENLSGFQAVQLPAVRAFGRTGFTHVQKYSGMRTP
jgi:hypothetical protein